MPRILLLLAVFISLCVTGDSATIPAFPGAEGYGAYAVGGRNGDVYHVTNLNASGAGSFADAIATVPSAGRTIVFDVSGYIRFPSSSNGTRLTASKVTIAGQTAPGDGIGFYNNFFRISGDDVVVRHVRFRMGYYGSGGDCVDLDSGCLNAILDHVSMEFSTDENMSSFSSPPENLTLQWSLNAWGLETHSCGGLWDQSHATSHHNLWAFNHTRNPKSRPLGLLEWINNVTYDWDIGFIMGDTTSVENYKANVIGSYFISPPGNTQSKAFVKGTVATNNKPNFSLYLSNCFHDSNGDGILNGTDKGWSIVEGTAYDPAGNDAPASGSLGYYKYTTPFANTGSLSVTTDDPLLAYKKVVSSAGALRMDTSYTGTLRDEVDTILFSRLVTQTHMSYSGETGIHKESDTGASNSGFGTLSSSAAPTDTDRDGMPDYYETVLGWNAGADDHATALANNGTILTGTTFFPANTPAGYTRLEEYLYYLSIPHGTVPKNVSGSPTSLTIDLRKYTNGFTSSPVFTIANVIGGTVTQSGTGGYLATFTPTLNYTGRGRFEFAVTDAAGSSWTQTFGIVVTNAGLPRDLTWKGSGSAWDSATTNWLRPSDGTTVSFSAGDRVTFDQTGSAQSNVTVNETVAPSTMDVITTGTYTFSGTGSISSSGALTKRGSGLLSLNNTGANSFGAASIEDGSVLFNNASASGSSKISFNGGNATFSPASNASVANPLEFNLPATITIGSQHTETGNWTGSSAVTINGSSSYLWSVSGTWTGFTGTINFGSGNVKMRLNGGTSNTMFGSPSVAINLGSGSAQLMNRNGSATAFDIGSLEATGTATQLQGTQTLTAASTYNIGALNRNTTFAGIIANGGPGGITNINKVGTGTLTLSGSSSYTGTTTVSAGWLLVDGALGTTPVTVASGAFLGGAGIIGGNLTASAGATLSPGTIPFTGATMTVNGNLALNGNTLFYDMSSSPSGANDKIAMTSGTLALSGTQYFQFLLLQGVLTSGTYDLITGATNSTASNVGLTHNLPTDTRQTFTLSRASAGSNPSYVRLTVIGNTAALVWTGTNNGGTWDTQSTANWSGGPTATFFNNDIVTFNDTSTANTVNIGSAVAPRIITINNNTTSYTFNGAGSITGNGQLIKSGAGLLTISGSNSYSGGTTINAGSAIILANDTANAYGLGTGSIIFNSGTLSMFSNATTFNSATYNMVIPAGQTGRLNADARCDLYGTLSGDGTFNFFVPYIRTTLYSDWSAFTGTINVITDNDGGDLRMGTNYSFPGFPLATVNLGDRVWAYYVGTLAQGAGTTIEIGELAGTALSVLEGGPTGGRNFTYRIGGKTLAGNEVTFAGTIQEQNSSTTTSFTKTGDGIWTLSGACSWNGGTTVEQGTLKISGSMGCGAAVGVNAGATLNLAGGTISADTVNIDANATLTGRGTINSDLTNNSTITCSQGGQLLVTGDVVNNGTMRLTGGTALVATGAFVNNGVLDLLTGAGGLPPNLVNNGVVIDSSSLALKSTSLSGATFQATIQSYTGHNYQLQRADVLIGGTWQDIDSAQAGNGSVLTFTDSGGASGTKRFYRIKVSP